MDVFKENGCFALHCVYIYLYCIVTVVLYDKSKELVQIKNLDILCY